MTDEQRLSDALHEIVPSPPPRPDRGPDVEERVRRHRRRTGAAVALAAAAVVAAAVAVPAALSGADGRDGPVATPSPTATEPALDLACPPEDQSSTSPDTLPTGAVAVRLCQSGSIRFDVPADVLTTDVDQLVAVVNEQPEADPSAMCTMELGRGYQLVFAYEDGETSTVTGELYSCHNLHVGSTTRSGAEAPFRWFMRTLRDQRGAAEPPTSQPPSQLDAGAGAEEVVAAYIDRLNAGDVPGATALWISLVDVTVPAGYTRIDYRVEDVHPLPRISAWRDATAVVARYREVVRDPEVPYRRTVFTLGRDENGAFRIVHVNVGQVIEGGR